MKARNKMTVLVTTLIFIFLQTITVFAADTTNTISLKLAEYQKDRHCAKVHCKMQIKDDVTNGKLRITYDKKQLKLVSSESGKGLENGMCEINDCLTGNKKEGEIVVAFASAELLPKDGNLLELAFELEKGVKEEEPVQIGLKIEKIANHDAEVNAKENSLTFTIGEGEIENPNNNSQGDSKGDNTQTDKIHSNGTASKQNTVKTGDNTKILVFAIAGVAALTVVAGCIISKKKNR